MRWLITAEELYACYERSDVVVADCRFSLADPSAGEREYWAGHVPGSHYLHLDRDLSSPPGLHGGRHPLPAPSAFATTMAAIGIDSNPPSLVVVYDDSRFAFASRLWWLLRYHGHDYVRVLDGGWKAWRDAGLPVATEPPPAPPPARFTPALRPELVMTIAEVRDLQRRSGAALIDSREERRYLGLEEPIDPVAGHIEGAVNRPWQDVSDESGRFRPLSEQRQRWGNLLELPELAAYCGSGVTACVNLLSLAELGREDARLYAGSWSDWCSYLPAASKDAG